MAEPQPPKKKSQLALVLLILAGVLGVPCVVGVVVAVVIPSFLRFDRRAMTAEARGNVHTLCRDELSYRREHGAWLAAGPTPKDVPRQAQVQFPPDEAFAALGFRPGRVRYQYEVVVDGDPKSEAAAVRCVARGDLDGDGRTSLFEVQIGEDGELGPVRTQREME